MRRCDNVGMHDLVIRGGKVVDGTGAAPVTADVAIDGDQVVAVGQVDQAGTREIEADGALVTPGWVDVHTHYDGQATWDPVMRPSIDHGVTTAVMGNCGVGFAPVRPGGEAFLIELMEAIEDIPGTALHEGIDWRWETFGEYIDALAEMPRTLDLGTTVPHAAVRAYVLGDRCHEYDVDAAEIGEIARVMADGVRAGALGVSTSRTTGIGCVMCDASQPACHGCLARRRGVRDSARCNFGFCLRFGKSWHAMKGFDVVVLGSWGLYRTSTSRPVIDVPCAQLAVHRRLEC